MAMEKSLQKRL